MSSAACNKYSRRMHSPPSSSSSSSWRHRAARPHSSFGDRSCPSFTVRTSDKCLAPTEFTTYDDDGAAHDDQQLCNADGSPIDVYRLELRPEEAKRDPRLRPYIRARRLQRADGLALRLVGSAVAATWQYLLFFAAYAVAMAFLFDLVLEEEAPDVFTVPWASFINSAMFAVGFFLSAKLFGGLNKYAEGIRVFYDVADAIGTAWLHVQAQAIRFPLSYCVPAPRYARPEPACLASGNLDARSYVRTVYVQKVRIYEEMQDIGRALIFALKWQFRTKPATSRFEATVSSDVDLGAPSVDPFRLPMVSYLQYELAQAETDYVTGLLGMWASRVALLITNGVDGEGDAARSAYQEELSAFLVHINAVGTQVSRMSSNQVLGLPAPVSDLLWLALLAVFALQPWALWAELRYYMLIVYGLELVFFFSIWGLSQKIGNPFDRFDDSPFIFHDLGQLSRDVAHNVDDQAEKLIAEVLSLNEFYKDRGFMGDAGRGGKSGAIGSSVAARRGGGASRQRFDAVGAAVTPGAEGFGSSWSSSVAAAAAAGSGADESAYHVHNSIGKI